jgi:hypothetical protein
MARIFFLLATTSRLAQGHPACAVVVIQPEHEANHSPLSNDKVKNVLSFASTSPYFLHCMKLGCGDSFTFKFAFRLIHICSDNFLQTQK